MLSADSEDGSEEELEALRERERAREVRREEAEYFDFLQSERFSMAELRRRIVPHE